MKFESLQPSVQASFASHWIIANWKMNGSMKKVKAFQTALHQVMTSDAPSPIQKGLIRLGWCLPFPYLLTATTQRSADSTYPVIIGAQNVHDQPDGAFTGEVSAAMLADVGAQFALVGHSERRSAFSENDDCIRAKLKLLFQSGLDVVLCVGETSAEHEAGQSQTVVRNQVSGALQSVSDAHWQRLIVAYEPVWAIGTGKHAEPKQVQAMHRSIREILLEYSELGARIPIIYGGSVNTENALALLAAPDIQGALVGGASLQFDSFWGIVQAGCAAAV